MSERLQLQSLEHSNLYKRRTTSKENLLQAGEPFRATTMDRLYQNGPIRNPAPLYSNVVVVPDKQQFAGSPSALAAADAIVRDLSSVSLGSAGNSSGTTTTTTTDRYQNVPPLASSTPVRRKMELREQSGRSNVEVIGLVGALAISVMINGSIAKVL